MVATTPRNSIPYPQQGDSPNEATAMANLVGQIDRRMVPRFTDAANRTSRVPSPTEGMYGYRNDVHRFEIYRGGAWQPAPFARTVVKAADTARTLTTTGAADPELQIGNIYSGRTYMVEANLQWFGDVGTDLNVGFGGPTISNGAIAWNFVPSTATTSTNTTAHVGSIAAAALNLTPLVAGSVGTSQIATATLRLTCTPSANGTFSVYWAQNVSSAIATTMLSGSYMTVTMIG